jgi:hypothetical protein
MKKSTAIRTTVAAGVAAAGLTVGGIGLASAADDTPSSSESGTTADHRPGPGGPGMFDSAELAEALGVSEDELEAALEAVRDERAPSDGDRTTPPSDEDRDEMRSRFAAALAEELGLTEEEVTAALDELHEDREADARSALSDRLDEAVEAGDLTAADKESVLKAFDAGVLGGGPIGHHGPA